MGQYEEIVLKLYLWTGIFNKMNVEGEEVEESRAKLKEGFLVTAKGFALSSP